MDSFEYLEFVVTEKIVSWKFVFYFRIVNIVPLGLGEQVSVTVYSMQCPF